MIVALQRPSTNRASQRNRKSPFGKRVKSFCVLAQLVKESISGKSLKICRCKLSHIESQSQGCSVVLLSLANWTCNRVPSCLFQREPYRLAQAPGTTQEHSDLAVERAYPAWHNARLRRESRKR